MEPLKRAEIEALISENNVIQISNVLEENPQLLLENRKLIKKARTPQMVQTLLQLNLLSHLMDSEKLGSQTVTADNDQQKRETILRAIKATFSTVLKRWPKLALEVLEKHVSYRGFCQEDPELQVEVDFSLLTGGELSKNYFCSLSKPKHLIHLSSLNVNNSTTKDILLHPVVLTYLHLNTGFEWAMFFLKFSMLLCGMMSSVTFVFLDTLPDLCPSENVYTLLERRGFQIAVAGASFSYILSGIHFIIEMFKFFVLGKHYIGGLVFQLYLILSFALVAIRLGKMYLLLINFNLTLLFNFLVCLSSAPFCGKYILVSIGILRTMLKVVFPIILVLMALAGTEFVLRYDEILKGVFAKIQEVHKTEFAKSNSLVETCAITAPFSGDLGVAEVVFYLKSFFHVLNIMHGQTDTADLTLNYEDLRDQTSVLDSSYAVYWIVCTSFTTIILMNLLVGLTIGDIDEIGENADCHIVQIKLRKLYLRCVWKSFIKCLLCNFCQGNKSERVYTVLYPNKYKGGCTVKARKDAWAKISSRLSTTYIIGCSKVRKCVLQHFK